MSITDVIPHEIGKMRNRHFMVWTEGNTVRIHTIRTIQMPMIVSIAGSEECPMPRKNPAGTSNRPQNDCRDMMIRILHPAIRITSSLPVNIPATCVLNKTVGKRMRQLHKSG